MRLHHVVTGDGPTVVLLGSLGSTVRMWEPQLSALAGFRVLRVDLPGHGGSEVPDRAFTIHEIADAVRELVDGPASYCGVSLGGVIAMSIAANAEVDRLVLACTKPSFPPPEQWAQRAALVRRDGVAAIADAVLARWFVGEPPGWAREMFLSIPAEGYARCCDALGGADLSSDLDRTVAPTLAIGGRDDPSVTPAEIEALPGRHVLIPDAAHLASAERPDVFNAALTRHLAAA